MPSTYTTNLFLQKPATGEQAGTWGFTANDNYDFLDDAIDGNLQIPVTSTGYTLNTQQDIPSEGRNKVLIFTGSLTAGITITIQPNTIKKLYLVTNNTTGGQALTFQQGTGGTFTLENGYSAMIYTDGAGAAAKVDGALYNPQFGSVSVPGIIRSTGSAGWPATGRGVVVWYKPVTEPTLPHDLGFIQCVDFTATTVANEFLPLAIEANPLSLNVNAAPVGIGTLTPTYPLDVLGAYTQGYGVARFKSTDNRGYISVDTTGAGGGAGIFFRMDGVWVGEIDAYGGMDFWTQNTTTPPLQITSIGQINIANNVGIGTVTAPDPLTIAGPLGNQIRMVYGSYGVFFRNDGSNFYVMVTNPGDPYGGWGTIFPLVINLPARTVSIYNAPTNNFALNVGGDVNITGDYRINGVSITGGGGGGPGGNITQIDMDAVTVLPPIVPADTLRIFLWRETPTVPPTIVFEVNWQNRPYYLYPMYDVYGAASWHYATVMPW